MRDVARELTALYGTAAPEWRSHDPPERQLREAKGLRRRDVGCSFENPFSLSESPDVPNPTERTWDGTPAKATRGSRTRASYMSHACDNETAWSPIAFGFVTSRKNPCCVIRQNEQSSFDTASNHCTAAP